MTTVRATPRLETPLGEPIRTRPFTVDEYHRMIDAGILGEDEHVELLEGQIVQMSPQGEPHARVIVRLTRILARALGDEFEVRPQLPLTLGESEPQPDLAVVRAEESTSADTHPTRALLVVESSGGSLGFDRTVKARVYVSAGIPEYWIVNVRGRCVEVHRDPDSAAGRYRSVSTAGHDDTLRPAALSELTIPVSLLFE